MIISYQTHPAIKLRPGRVSVLATNNQTVFAELINAVQGINDKLLVTTDDYESLEVTKALDWDTGLVLSGTVFSHYSRELISKFAREIDEANRVKLAEQGRRLFATVQEALFMSSLPLQVTYDGDIKRLLKYCNPQLVQVGRGDFCGTISDDLRIHLELGSKSCVCLNNVANYLTPDAFSDLLATVEQINLPLFLIEFTEMAQRGFYGNADYFYIDQDFVDWQL